MLAGLLPSMAEPAKALQDRAPSLSIFWTFCAKRLRQGNQFSGVDAKHLGSLEAR